MKLTQLINELTKIRTEQGESDVYLYVGQNVSGDFYIEHSNSMCGNFVELTANWDYEC